MSGIWWNQWYIRKRQECANVERKGREGGFKYETFRETDQVSLQNNEEKALIGATERTITGTMRKSDSNSLPRTAKENQC